MPSRKAKQCVKRIEYGQAIILALRRCEPCDLGPTSVLIEASGTLALVERGNNLVGLDEQLTEFDLAGESLATAILAGYLLVFFPHLARPGRVSVRFRLFSSG